MTMSPGGAAERRADTSFAPAGASDEDAHIAAFRQINPEIRVESGDGHALQKGGAHSSYLELNFRFAESDEKPSERRNFVFSSHRWSGVAAMLRAKRIASCSLKCGMPRRSLRRAL
jgi:hypothetical protein